MKYIITFLFWAAAIWPATFLQAETIVVSVSQQNDDAEEDVTGPQAGDVRRTSADLEIGNENGVEQWVGVRFQGLQIPAGSIINSATIQFTADDTDVGNLIIPVVGELSLNPAQFRDVTPLTTRTLTSNSVDWIFSLGFQATAMNEQQLQIFH